MAIGFGSLGAGASDSISLSSSSTGTQRTYAFIVNRASSGGGTLGRIIQHGNDLFATGTVLRFQRNASTTNGAWNVSFVDGETAYFVITYDSSSNANIPVFWKNGSTATVVTPVQPVGTIAALGATSTIGNIPAATRNWDGWIARMAVWTSILPDSACASISKGASPLKYSPSTLDFYLPMLKLGRDVSRNARTTTITGTAFQTHPRVLGGYR